MKRRRRLTNAQNTYGRVDVLLYRLAERWMQQVETERELPGLREQLLPLVEKAIIARVPAGNMIPEELRSFVTLCEQNFRSGRC